MKIIRIFLILLLLIIPVTAQENQFNYDPDAEINQALNGGEKDGFYILLNNRFKLIQFRDISNHNYNYATYHYGEQYWRQILPGFNPGDIRLEEYFISINLEITELDRIRPGLSRVPDELERTYFNREAPQEPEVVREEKEEEEEEEEEEESSGYAFKQKLNNQEVNGFKLLITHNQKRLQFRDLRNPDLVHGYYDLDRMCWDTSTKGTINKDYMKLNYYLEDFDLKKYKTINVWDPEDPVIREYKTGDFYNYSRDRDFKAFINSPPVKKAPQAIQDHYKIAARDKALREKMQTYFDLHNKYVNKENLFIFKDNRTVPLTIIQIEPQQNKGGEMVILRDKELARKVEEDLEFYFHKDFKVSIVNARMDYHIIYKNKNGKMTMPEEREKIMAEYADSRAEPKQLILYCFVNKTEQAAAGIHLNTPLGRGAAFTDWYEQTAAMAIHELGHQLMLPHHFYQYTEQNDINFHTSRACVMNYHPFTDFQFCELCRYALNISE